MYEDFRSGDLLKFEEGLIQILGGFYHQLCEQVLKGCSEELASSLKKQAHDEGCQKLVRKPIKFRLRTGHFDTLWREPKLFTIDVLDKQGNLDSAYLPIYDCRFDEQDIIELLG